MTSLLLIDTFSAFIAELEEIIIVLRIFKQEYKSMFAGPDKTLVAVNSITLAASTNENNVIYNWSPIDFLSDPTILNPICTATRSMTYTLTI